MPDDFDELDRFLLEDRYEEQPGPGSATGAHDDSATGRNDEEDGFLRRMNAMPY